MSINTRSPFGPTVSKKGGVELELNKSCPKDCFAVIVLLLFHSLVEKNFIENSFAIKRFSKFFLMSELILQASK